MTEGKKGPMTERNDKTYQPMEWDETDAVWNYSGMTNRSDQEAAYRSFCEQSKQNCECKQAEPWNAYKASAVHWQQEAERYREDAKRAEDYNRKLVNEIKAYRGQAIRAEQEAEALRKKLAEQGNGNAALQLWFENFVRNVGKVTVTFGNRDDEW